MDFKAEIANISNEATQEIGLEELLAKVQNKVSEIYKVQTKSFKCFFFFKCVYNYFLMFIHCMPKYMA
jgi:hypothetical protein